MSEKREKRRRYNQRLEYIADFNKWLDAGHAGTIDWLQQPAEETER